MQPSTTARDFFLHLGAMASLYALAISLMNLLFKIINNAYPPVDYNIYAWGGSSQISLPVATLIIVFPIFVLLSWLIEKSYSDDPNKKQVAVRRWLVYITLFVAGVVLVGDLVTVLYKFLDGQDLTAAFLLKALSVLALSALILGFYLQDIRNRISSKGKKVWAIAALVIILISIVLGFAVIGSPQTQRLLRYDEQKIQDLQNIQWQIINYWQRKGELPQTFAQVEDPISGYIIPADPQSGEQYEYQKATETSFKLCAEFNKASQTQGQGSLARPIIDPYGKGMESWNHEPGRQCFTRTIDPDLYPITKTGPLR